MHSAKESLKDAASSAKKNAKMLEAKAEEQALKGTARSGEERKIIEQQRKAKEAETKMELHEAKARHAEETLTGKAKHHLTGTAATHHLQPHAATAAAGHYPPGNPVAGATDPMYPTGGGHVPPTAGHRTTRHF